MAMNKTVVLFTDVYIIIIVSFSLIKCFLQSQLHILFKRLISFIWCCHLIFFKLLDFFLKCFDPCLHQGIFFDHILILFRFNRKSYFCLTFIISFSFLISLAFLSRCGGFILISKFFLQFPISLE